jgi:hypothetical protein
MYAHTHTHKHRLKRSREVILCYICGTRLIGLAAVCTSVVEWCTWWCNPALTLCRSYIKKNLHMAFVTHYFPRRCGSASVGTSKPTAKGVCFLLNFSDWYEHSAFNHGITIHWIWILIPSHWNGSGVNYKIHLLRLRLIFVLAG